MEQIISFFQELWSKIRENWQLSVGIAAAVLLVLILLIVLSVRSRKRRKAQKSIGIPNAALTQAQENQNEPIVESAEKSDCQVPFKGEEQAKSPVSDPVSVVSDSASVEKESVPSKGSGADEKAESVKIARQTGSDSPAGPRKVETAEEIEVLDEEEKDEVRRNNSRYRVSFDRETSTWIVKKSDNQRVTRRVKTKKEALEIAKELCKHQDMNLTVHKKDGKFQKKR